MRLLLSAMCAVAAAGLVPARADVTIRYQAESSSPGSAPLSSASVIYMKGNKGVTIADNQTTIVDFGRQQVTVIDTARRKYAAVPVTEYAAKMAADVWSLMPENPEVAEILKSARSSCETKTSEATERIQGVQTVESEVACTTTMAMPDAVKATMPAMTMKLITRVWSAASSERLRVPGLWQLSEFELWQNYFMNPFAAGKMIPEGMKPMVDAMQKDQSATLRSSVEMSMRIAMPGIDASDTPIMKGSREMVGLSTELLDDSRFSVPGDYSAEPLEVLMKAFTDDREASAKTNAAKVAFHGEAIPQNVKAYVPVLFPLTQTAPVAPLDAKGSKVQGMVQLLVTVEPAGNVEQAEALTGPADLRKAAIDAVQKWTFRPVIRDRVAVTAYTQTTVNFVDFSKERAAAPVFEFTPEMQAADERLAQLQNAFLRTPEQEFADLEQDASGNDSSRRYDRLGELALRAVRLGADDKAKAYATELLAAARNDAGGWNYGNAIHAGHSVPGLLALREGDIPAAREQLLEAGSTPGSPQLNSFGPDMTLATEMVKRGERDTVLAYFERCRKFWKMGGARLDSWEETVRQGGTPALPVNMPQ